jgi:2-methylcitrate dehydratase PrpD
VGLKEALKSSASQPIQVARSCEGGVVAALLAGQGAEGADSILEGGFLKAFADHPATADMLTGLGTDFRIFETYVKVHGGCRGNHAPVDVVRDVVKANAIKPEAIASLLIRVDSVTHAAEIHEPANGNEAQFSIAFAVAAALVKGDASIFQYTDANLADPRIREVMSRIRVEVDKRLDEGYPDKRASSAEITLADGRRFTGHIDNAKGEPECPLSAADIESKFLVLTRDILAGGGERVRDLVMGLETIQDLNILGACLKAAVRS